MSSAGKANGDRLSLTAFIKVLTSQIGLNASEALGCASALIKAGFNTAGDANPFAGVSDVSLVSAGVTDSDVRKTIIAYGRSSKAARSSPLKSTISDVGGPGTTHRKRKSRDSDLDTPLRDEPYKRKAMNLDFDEEKEDVLFEDRSIVINRAPVMTAWATIVAERLGFSRTEALSIAHTYTNMNAAAKGVSLGIYSPEEGKQRTTVGSSQPYVELMGRRIPMLALQNGEWRGIANGTIAEPEQAFGYIQRSFRQHMRAAIGALRMLGDTYDPDDLNKAGYELYIDFRPEVQNWGQKGHLHLKRVLELRKGRQRSQKADDDRSTGEEVATVADLAEDVLSEAAASVERPASIKTEVQTLTTKLQETANAEDGEPHEVKLEYHPPELVGENSAGGDHADSPTRKRA